MVNKYDNYELKKVNSLENVPGTIKDGDGYIWDPSELPDKDFDDSKVPLNYRRLGIWMRSKLFGKDVRETIARLAEMFGLNFKELMESFESLEGRQGNLETQTAQDVAQMKADKNAVIANATVDSEVILARGGKATLGERLDDTNAQLAQVGTYLTDTGIQVNDPTVDATDYIKQAIQSSNGGTIYFPKNAQIYLKTPLDVYLSTDLTIEGNGSTIIKDYGDSSKYYGDPDNNNTRFSNQVKKTTTISNSVDTLKKDDTTIIVSDVSDIKVGDGIELVTNEIYSERYGFGTVYEKGFVTKVHSITGRELTIDKLPFSFDNVNYTVNIKVFNPVQLNINNLTIEAKGDPTGGLISLIGLRNFFNSKLSNIKLINANVESIYITGCYNMLLEQVSIDGNLSDGGGLYYGIAVYGGNKIVISKANIHTLRTSITLSGVPPVDVKAYYSFLTSIEASAFDSHCSHSSEVYNTMLKGRINPGLGSMKFYNCDVIGQKNMYSNITVRADVSSFLGELLFKDTTFKLDGSSTESHHHILFFPDASNLEYVEKITFDGCEFTSSETKDTRSIIGFNALNLNEHIGDIVIKNNTFNGTYLNLIYDQRSTFTETSDTTHKGSLILENNTFEDSRGSQENRAMSMFKKIYILNNKGAFLSFDLNGGSNLLYYPDVFMVDNISESGNFRVGNITGDILFKNNVLLSGDNLGRFTTGGSVYVLNNLFSNQIRIQNPPGVASGIGWNRRLDGSNPYEVVSTGIFDYEKNGMYS